jgi:hypothetical protein
MEKVKATSLWAAAVPLASASSAAVTSITLFILGLLVKAGQRDERTSAVDRLPVRAAGSRAIPRVKVTVC